MVDKWVVKALQHITGKLLQLLHRQVESLHQLVELYLVDVLGNHLVVAGITHDVDTTQEGNGAQYGVRAIQQGHLTLVVGLL